MSNKICIFLGPSLPLTEAQFLLPDAIFLPPARKGDILRSLRYHPKYIVLIDGVFESVSTVWHKEILFVLNIGVRVFGASSMGALRASELYPYGMEGSGKIFDLYKRGILTRDDEVALLHAPKELGYKPLTEALVDVRATVEQATKYEIIDHFIASKIMDIAKSTHFKKRSWANLLNIAKNELVNAELKINKFSNWLETGNHYSQKAIDAQNILKNIHHKIIDNTNTLKLKTTSFMTEHLADLYRDISSGCVQHYSPKLPLDEKFLYFSRLLPTQFVTLKRLAKLYSILDQEIDHCSDAPATTHHFLKVIDEIAINKASNFSFTNDYQNTKIQKLSDTIIKHTASAWWEIEQRLSKNDIKISGDNLEKGSIYFRRIHALEDKPTFVKWLRKHQLDHKEFICFIGVLLKFDLLAKSKSLQMSISSKTFSNTSWLLYCAKQVGILDEIKLILSNNCARQQAIETLNEAINMNLYTASQLDFDSNQESIDVFFRNLEKFCESEA